jgi:hypothetical protein
MYIEKNVLVSIKTVVNQNNVVIHEYSSAHACLITSDYTPPQTKFGGVYRNHPVRPSMYLVSATPPKPPIGLILDSNGIPSCTSAGCVLQLCKVS